MKLPKLTRKRAAISLSVVAVLNLGYVAATNLSHSSTPPPLSVATISQSVLDRAQEPISATEAEPVAPETTPTSPTPSVANNTQSTTPGSTNPYQGGKDDPLGYIYDRRASLGKYMPSARYANVWAYQARQEGAQVYIDNPQVGDIATLGSEAWIVESVTDTTVVFSGYWEKPISKTLTIENAKSGAYKYIH